MRQQGEVSGRVVSVGVDEKGKSVVRIAVETEGRPGVRMIRLPTSVQSMAELAAAGFRIINGAA